MRKSTLATLLVSSILSTPALAVNGISLDGASMMLSYQDPHAIPVGVPTDARYGGVNFRFSSIGQVNDGWVQYFTTMYPSNQYDGPFKIRFTDTSFHNDNCAAVPGAHLRCDNVCVYLTWDIEHAMGNNDDGSLDLYQLQQYHEARCDLRPDPHLFQSGDKMGIELLLSSLDGGWLDAQWYEVAPMDGGQYDVTIFWGTGRAGIGSPVAKLVVSKRGGETGTLSDPDYLDASYNYNGGDGFDVPLNNLFWQLGCDTTDTNYVDTCGTFLTAEFWLDTADDEAVLDFGSLNTFTGFFLSSSGDNSAPYLGAYGQQLTGIPPMSYHTGDDTTFLTNAADVGYGLTVPQTYVSLGWAQNGISNPNYNFLGAGIQAAGQDF
jgi:hypothetical protein